MALGVRRKTCTLRAAILRPGVGVVVLTEVLGSKMLAHVEVAGEPVATRMCWRVSSMKAMSPCHVVAQGRRGSLVAELSRTRRSWPAIASTGRESERLHFFDLATGQAIRDDG